MSSECCRLPNLEQCIERYSAVKYLYPTAVPTYLHLTLGMGRFLMGIKAHLISRVPLNPDLY